MKTFKKALSIILGLALMLSCVAGMQVSVAAEETTTTEPAANTLSLDVPTQLTLEYSEDWGGYFAGIDIYFAENAKFNSLGLKVEYASDVVELGHISEDLASNRVKAGNLVDGSYVTESGDDKTANPYRMIWTFVDEMEAFAEEKLAFFQFKYKGEEAPEDGFSTKVKVTPYDAFLDDNGTPVEVALAEESYEVELVYGEKEPEGPAVDPALIFRGASISYGTTSLEFNFRIAADVINLYPNMELVLIPEKYDSSFNLVEDPQEIVVNKSELTVSGKYYTYNYLDIQLYELGLNIGYMLRAYDAEGNLVKTSELFGTSPADYLKKVFVEETDTSFRTLVTDTLVVGYEAAEAMKVEGSDLYDAASIIEGFDISEATPDASVTFENVDTYVPDDTNFANTSGSTHRVRYSPTIGKVPYLGFRINGASSLDVSKFSYKVTYTQRINKTDTKYEKSFDSSNFKVSGAFVVFDFVEVGLQDSNKDLYIELFYDGIRVSSLTYRIETYLGNSTGDPAIGDLCTALLKLGISFRAYAG